VRFRVNDPQVISETVGGETIIVNLATGHYFNLQGSAVEIWEGLARSEPVESIVATLAARYTAADGEIEAAVNGLVDELATAELVVPEESSDTVPPAMLPVSENRSPFPPPSFTEHTDMQDIILLDPVHEVDARGWPHAAANA
jgi:coenzyme PQQ synthesis protein D (PqqD)